MSIKILTKSGEEITAIDDARAYNFDAGNKSGIVKGALNEGKFFLVSSNVIGLDSCELRISGHRIVIDSAESITMANRPSVATRYSMIAEVVVSDASVPSFRLFIQPTKTELIQQNLYKTLNGNGTYQLRIGNFTLGTDGLISDIVRTADVISGSTNGVGDIEFNVTTETIAGDLEPEVNVDFNEETKKYDMHFALPLSSGTSVIENGEVVKRFNADLKVNKEEGKGLSTNDFTTAEKNKLAGLSNYNDTSLTNKVSILESDNTTNKTNINDLQNNRAKLDASNLTTANVESWNDKLGTSQKIVDYIVPSNTSLINITNLDIVADGGVYEITINGLIDDYIYMNVNNNNSSSHNIRINIFRDSPLSQYQASQPYFIAGCNTRVGKIYLYAQGSLVGIFTEGQGVTSGQYATYLTMGLGDISSYNNNVTSIQLGAGTNKITAGTRITVKKLNYNSKGVVS